MEMEDEEMKQGNNAGSLVSLGAFGHYTTGAPP